MARQVVEARSQVDSWKSRVDGVRSEAYIMAGKLEVGTLIQYRINLQLL